MKPPLSADRAGKSTCCFWKKPRNRRGLGHDTYAGIRLCPPYRFPVGELLVTGRNTLRIEVTNTLENQMRGKVSPVTSILHASGFTLPVGLTGKVEIYSADAG